MLYTQTYKPEPKKIKIYQNIYSLFISKKKMDFIHINKILRNEEVTSKLPNFLQTNEKKSIVYNLGSTSRDKDYKEI